MSNVGGLSIFIDGTTIAGAALDTNFTNILTVVNGNIRAENFNARAGFGLQNRARKGNNFSVTGGTTSFTRAACGGPTDTTVLIDVTAEDLIGDIPGVFKVLSIGANIETLAGYTEVDDEIDLNYRLFNTRVGDWTAWATQIDDLGGWIAGTARTSTAGGAVGAVIGEKDYERIQLVFAVTAAAGADVVLTGVSCWVNFEALHVP